MSSRFILFFFAQIPKQNKDNTLYEQSSYRIFSSKSRTDYVQRLHLDLNKGNSYGWMVFFHEIKSLHSCRIIVIERRFCNELNRR